MNTQPSDAKKKEPARMIVFILGAALLLASGGLVLFKFLNKSDHAFLTITGAEEDAEIIVSLKSGKGQDIVIPELEDAVNETRTFDYKGQGKDYTLKISLRDKTDVKNLSMAVHSRPTMIVINAGGFSQGDGLDLYVGENSISSRTPFDWGGNLEQTIPLPKKAKKPFCLSISGADNAETLRACHKLPNGKAG